MPESMGAWLPADKPAGSAELTTAKRLFVWGFAVEAVLFELFVKRVAVDAEATGGFDLHAGAFLKDLVDSFAFDRIDDASVDVVGVGAGVGQSDADKFLGKSVEIELDAQ